MCLGKWQSGTEYKIHQRIKKSIKSFLLKGLFYFIDCSYTLVYTIPNKVFNCMSMFVNVHLSGNVRLSPKMNISFPL